MVGLRWVSTVRTQAMHGEEAYEEEADQCQRPRRHDPGQPAPPDRATTFRRRHRPQGHDSHASDGTVARTIRPSRTRRAVRG